MKEKPEGTGAWVQGGSVHFLLAIVEVVIAFKIAGPRAGQTTSNHLSIICRQKAKAAPLPLPDGLILAFY